MRTRLAAVALLSACHAAFAQTRVEVPVAVENVTSTPAGVVVQGEENFLLTLAPQPSLAPLAGPAAGAKSFRTKPLGKATAIVAFDPGKQAVLVLDDTLQKIVKEIRIDINGELIDLAAAASPDVPWVYYSAGAGQIGRVDLIRGVDEGRVTGLNDNDRRMIYASSDGTVIYSFRPSTSPSGLHAFEVRRDGGKGPLIGTVLRYEHEESTDYIADPFGSYVATGPTVYDVLLNRQLGRLPGKAAAVGREYSVILCSSDRQLAAVSPNTMRTFGKLDLPKPQGEIKRGNKNSNQPMTATLVEATQQVVAAIDSELFVVPFSALKIVKEPPLSVTQPEDKELNPGVAWAFKLTPATSDAQLSIIKAPKGATLDKGSLKWTPAPEDIGQAEIVVRAAKGDISRDTSILVSVAQPHITLPFVPGLLAISPDGKRAIATENSDPSGFSRAEGKTWTMLLVDLETSTIIAEQQLKKQPQALAMSNDKAFVVPFYSDIVNVFDAKTFAEKPAFNIKSQVNWIKVIGDTLFLPQENGAPAGYDLAKLEPIKTPLFTRDKDSREQIAMPHRVGNDAFYNGALWDLKFTAPAKLIVDAKLPATLASRMDEFRQPRRYTGEPMQTAPLSPWNVIQTGTGLMRSNGQRLIDDRRDGAPVMLQSIPAAVVLKPMSGNPQKRLYELQIIDLVHGEEAAELPLMSSEAPSRGRYENGGGEMGPSVRTLEAGDICLVPLRRSLFPIKRSTLTSVAKLTAPLTIEPCQSQTIVTLDKPTQLKYTASGGVGDRTFSLEKPADGVSVDPKTGTISIDPKLLVPFVEQHLVQQAVGNAGHYRADELLKPGDDIKTRVTALTGTMTKGIPVVLPLNLIVTDSQDLTAVLAHQVILDVDAAPIEAAVTKERERVAVVQAKAREEEDARRREQTERMRRDREPGDAQTQPSLRRGATTRPSATTRPGASTRPGSTTQPSS